MPQGSSARPRPLTSLLTLSALGLTAICAPSAGAAVITFGSDLSAPANATFQRPHAAADTAYWQTAFADGRGTRVPAGGQIVALRLKGMALKRGTENPQNLVHFQRLITTPGGAMRVHPTGGTSNGFHVPFTGDPQQINEFRPTDFCVDQGDVVAFNDIGGYTEAYRNGVEHQVFSRVPGATLKRYTKDNGTNNGDEFTSPASGGVITENGVELLMQVVLATGPDAERYCPGGSRGVPAPQPGAAPGSGSAGGGPGSTGSVSNTRMTSTSAGVRSNGNVRLAVFCPRTAGCRGTVTLTRSGRRIGSARYAVDSRRTGRVTVRITRSAMSAIRRSRNRRVSARATVVEQSGGRATTSTRTISLRGAARR